MNASASLENENFSGVIRFVENLGAAFKPLTHINHPAQNLFNSGGLNFEHIFNGTEKDEKISWFTPRKDEHEIISVSPIQAIVKHDSATSAWAMDSEMMYALTNSSVDLDFKVRFHEDRFPLGYAAMMWASYMTGTKDRRIHFLGESGDESGWISFGKSEKGDIETGTVAARGAPLLPYEENSATLNIVESETKRFTQPFYYGLLDQRDPTSGNEIAYVMMCTKRDLI